MQSCTKWIEKYTVIMLFMDLTSITPLSNLAKITLPDRSTLVPQDFLCSYCFGPPRLTADQEKGLSTLLLLPLAVRVIYSLGWLVIELLAPTITVKELRI